MSSFVSSAPPEARSYSVPQVAELLGVSERTVWRMVANGELATLFPRRNGVKVRIPHLSLMARLENSYTDGPGGGH